MVDVETVCCMCGDVGFSDKLFRCNNCRNRFQHFYCSNNYKEYAEPVEVCDWCQSEQRRVNAVRPAVKHGVVSSKKSTSSSENYARSEYPLRDRIKQANGAGNKGNIVTAGSSSGAGSGSVPYPRTAIRKNRYKLLKDVMCRVGTTPQEL